MRRGLVYLFVTALCCGGSLVAWQVNGTSQHLHSATKRLYPKEPTDHLLWPFNYAWVWSVALPQDEDERDGELSVVARSVQSPLRSGESPVIREMAISKEQCQKAISFGRLGRVPRGTSATVSVQLIDLSEAALPIDNEKGSLRLLLTLQGRGAATYLRGQASMIEGTQVAGFSENEHAWKDGELHLMNLFVRAKDRLITYDIVVLYSRGG